MHREVLVRLDGGLSESSCVLVVDTICQQFQTRVIPAFDPITRDGELVMVMVVGDADIPVPFFEVQAVAVQSGCFVSRESIIQLPETSNQLK